MSFRSVLYILALVALALLSSCGGEGDNAAPVLLPPTVVHRYTDTAYVTTGPVAHIEIYAGIVRTSFRGVNLGATSGFFAAYYVTPGQVVEEGQLLARLNFESVQLRIDNQEERIATLRHTNTINNEIRSLQLMIDADANAQAMQQAAERFDEEAMESASNRRREIEQGWQYLEMTREQQAFTLGREEEYLASLHELLKTSELRAPFGGTVTYMVDKFAGSFVAPFMDIVFIAPHDTYAFVELMGNLPATPEQAARITAYVGGQGFDLTRLPLTTLQILHYQLDPQRLETLPMRFTFATQPVPEVGSIVSVHVYRHWYEEVLRVPTNALFRDPAPGGGYFVYRYEADTLTVVPVAVGTRTAAFAVILAGVEEGDVLHVGR